MWEKCNVIWEAHKMITRQHKIACLLLSSWLLVACWTQKNSKTHCNHYKTYSKHWHWHQRRYHSHGNGVKWSWNTTTLTSDWYEWGSLIVIYNWDSIRNNSKLLSHSMSSGNLLTVVSYVTITHVTLACMCIHVTSLHECTCMTV